LVYPIDEARKLVPLIKADTDLIRAYQSEARLAGKLDLAIVHATTLADPVLALEMDTLIDLIISEQKRGTAHLDNDFEKSRVARRAVGDYWIILGSDLAPRCLVRLTNVEVKPFDQVGEIFAACEGEGDLSLAHWRDVHRAYYQSQCKAWCIQWREDLTVVCESFELVSAS